MLHLHHDVDGGAEGALRAHTALICQTDVLLSRGTEPGWTAQQGGAQSPVLGRSKPRTLWGAPSREPGKALGHLGGTKLTKSHQKVKCALGRAGSIVTTGQGGDPSLLLTVELISGLLCPVWAPQCERDRDILERVKH